MNQIGTIAAAALLVCAAARAQETRPAAVYPIDGSGVAAEQIGDAQALLGVALLRQRSGVLRFVDDRPLRPSCGPAQTAQQACLAKLAGRGVVLRAILRRAAGPEFSLELSAIDVAARAFGPVRVRLDSSLTDARPVVDAVESLGAAIAQDAQVRRMAQSALPMSAPSPAAPPSRQVVPVAEAPVAHAVPPRETAPAAAVARVEAPRTPGAWMGPAGTWLVAGGAAAAAGGAVFGYLGQKLNNQLQARYAAHTLSPADSTSYAAIHRDAVLANTLFAAGGVLVVTGMVLWGLAPDVESNSLSLSGKF